MPAPCGIDRREPVQRVRHDLTITLAERRIRREAPSDLFEFAGRERIRHPEVVTKGIDRSGVASQYRHGS